MLNIFKTSMLYWPLILVCWNLFLNRWVDVGCMAGGWYLIFGSFAARFCGKNITLPPCYFASSSMQITLGHHQQKVPHPSNKIDQQNHFFVRISTLFFQQNIHFKGVCFGKYFTPLALPLPWKSQKSPPLRGQGHRIRIQQLRATRRCSTWYLDLCPLAPPPPIPSLRYLKGPWSIFDTVAMGIFRGLKDFPKWDFFGSSQ